MARRGKAVTGQARGRARPDPGRTRARSGLLQPAARRADAPAGLRWPDSVVQPWLAVGGGDAVSGVADWIVTRPAPRPTRGSAPTARPPTDWPAAPRGTAPPRLTRAARPWRA